LIQEWTNLFSFLVTFESPFPSKALFLSLIEPVRIYKPAVRRTWNKPQREWLQWRREELECDIFVTSTYVLYPLLDANEIRHYVRCMSTNTDSMVFSSTL
jgi:hypothetical protein